MQNQPYEFTKLIRCWQSMPRTAAKAPKKTTFSPINLASIMPFLFLIEKQQDGIFSVRILGNELEKKLTVSGRRPKRALRRVTVEGRYSEDSIFAAMMDRDWDFYSGFMETCTGQLCGGRMNREVKMEHGTACEIDSLHVPLADTEGVARFMLGVMLVRPASIGMSIGAKLLPKRAILEHQFIDLGSGKPAGLAVALPTSKVSKAIKFGAMSSSPVVAVGAKSPRGPNKEAGPTFVN